MMRRFDIVLCLVMLAPVVVATPHTVGAQSPPISFAPAPGSPLHMGAHDYDATVGDFNGDGKPDLILASSGSYGPPLTGRGPLLLNNGDGSFRQAPTDARSDLLPVGVAADFDGDGKLDLAYAPYASTRGIVSLLLGNGDGTFRPGPSTAEADLYPVALTAGDLNGDGKPDLVLIGGKGNGTITAWMFLNNGGGTFAPPVPLPLPQTQSNPVVGVLVRDLNGNGKADLVVTTTTSIFVALGNGDGTFRAAPGSPLPISGSIAVGDFDKDGKPDLAVGTSKGIIILRGNGDGSFAPSGTTIEDGLSVNIVGAGDFNGDGRDDLIVANVYGISLGPNGRRAALNVLLNTTGNPGTANPCVPILPFPDNADRRNFLETEHSLAYGFKSFWDAHGSVAIFGLPISEEFTERSATDGKTYTVQYFERERFEYHPEFKGTPYEVELGLLGSEATAGMRGQQEFQPTDAIGARAGDPHFFFPETRHNIILTPFARYWQENGGLAVFGYPISETIYQPDGTAWQYFERARMELHTGAENSGIVYLGLLGDEQSPCHGS